MSVLFDQNNGYYDQGSSQNSDNLQFYQSQYPDPSSGAYAGSHQQQRSTSFPANTMSPAPELGYGGYNPGIPGNQMNPQPTSWLAAFGTGGLEGEPPLLEGEELSSWISTRSDGIMVLPRYLTKSPFRCFDWKPELGVNFSHIKSKSFTVLNPLRPVDKNIMDDTDLAGPLLFCLAFGTFLLLVGTIRESTLEIGHHISRGMY